MCVFDDSSDATSGRFNILLGRHDEQFPVGILRTFLSEEIKAVLQCVMTVFVGESSTSFLQELLDQGLDFSCQ